MRQFLRLPRCLILLLILLVGCSGGGESLPTAAVPTPTPLPEATLPGRLLFVSKGVVWQWQGTKPAPLFGDGSAFQAAWSPTGDRIAYITRSNSFSDLLLADAQGQPVGQITRYGTSEPPNSLRRVYASRWVFYPTWTPDGKSIAAAAQPGPPVGDPPSDYNLSLTLLPLGATLALPLYSATGAQVGRSAFAPDGSALIFARATSGPNGQQRLYRLDLTTNTAAPLNGTPEPSYDPAFAPDGAWLAFAARDGDRTDIFALPANGSGTLQRLTAIGTARAPVFSPDGTQIAFLAINPGSVGFDLWVIDLQRNETGLFTVGTPRRLTNDQAIDADSGLSWAP
jgi:TolB protein